MTVSIKKADVPARFKSIIGSDESYVFKTYRGMGSLGAMQKGKEVASEDEFHGKRFDSKAVMVAEGVEGLVPSSGPLKKSVSLMLEGVRSGFYYVGAQNLQELWENSVLQSITSASLSESHPHDLFVTDAGNGYIY